MVAKARELTIGTLAKAASVNLETVRYYERIGLMPSPRRSGHRIYDDEAVRHLGFVRRGRELGFSIADIRSLMALATPDDTSCSDVKALASAHLENFRSKLRDLARLETVLSATIAKCVENSSPRCPILDVLNPPSKAKPPGEALKTGSIENPKREMPGKAE